jgi:hypothetical protein
MTFKRARIAIRRIRRFASSLGVKRIDVLRFLPGAADNNGNSVTLLGMQETRVD